MLQKIKVKLVKRLLPSGNTTLSLEYYGKGKRKIEALNMILKPATTSKQRAENKRTLELAQEIATIKQNIEIENKYQLPVNDTGGLDFIQFFEKEVPKTDDKTHNIQSAFNHFKRFCGGACTMQQLTPEYILQFVEYLKTANRLNSKSVMPLGANSKNNYLSKVCGVIKAAGDRNLLNGNPLKGFKVKKHFEPQNTERSFFTRTQIKELEKTECRVEVVKRAFLFSCYCGLRHGDVKALKWSDIKNDADLGNYLIIRAEKTKKITRLQLIDKALAQLGDKSNPSPFYGLLKSDQNQNNHMKRWFLRAGIDDDKAVFHSSRHSFAVNSLLAGVDIFTLRDLLGHSTVRTTEIYAQIVESMTTKASVKLNDYWNE